MTLKPLLVFHLYLIPRRITAHDIKATIVSEDFRELYAPMEETMPLRCKGDFCSEAIRETLSIYNSIIIIQILDFLKCLIYCTGIWHVKCGKCA